MNVTCSAQTCPVILDSTCVFYEGPNLICSGVNTNDNLETIIEKLKPELKVDGNQFVYIGFSLRTYNQIKHYKSI